jgi:oligosaccharide repeat unit polymerase
MTILLIILISMATIMLGRVMFGQWFNHVGLYAAVWGGSLALFHIGWIYYYPLEAETYLIIAAGWVAFVLGSAVVVAGRFAVRASSADSREDACRHYEDELRTLSRVLWTMNVITVADSVYEISNVSRIMGGFSKIFSLGNMLYTLRVQEGIPGAIPYVGTLTMTGALLAGYYTAKVGRVRFVAIIAVLTAIAISLASMVRATLVMAIILFVTGYFIERRKRRVERPSDRFRSVLSLVLLLALIVGGMEVIRGNRGMTEGFAGETSALKGLSVGVGSFVTPSVVMYLTVHHAVLNQYIRKDEEDVPIGHYSLAPWMRLLSKFGFDTYVRQHARFYCVPVPANTGSYLRDLHADYGLAGIIAGPFLLGLISSLCWFRMRRTHQLVDLVILGHVYVGVGMSLFTFATQMGVWVGSLLFGVILSVMMGQRRNPVATAEAHAPSYGSAC